MELDVKLENSNVYKSIEIQLKIGKIHPFDASGFYE